MQPWGEPAEPGGGSSGPNTLELAPARMPTGSRNFVPDATLDGEVVVFEAELSQRWMWMHWLSALTGRIFFTGLLVIIVLFNSPSLDLTILLMLAALAGFAALSGLDWCCCGPARQHSFDGWRLALTRTGLHRTIVSYPGCGICCRSQMSQTIPVDKIQDVQVRFAEHSTRGNARSAQ